MMKKIISGLVFFAGLFTLCGLSYWQVQRAEWKDDIIRKLNHEYAKNAYAYKLTPEDFMAADPDNFKVRRGVVQGRFLKGNTLLWPSLLNGNYGYQMMDPLVLESGHIAMVNRGWIPRKSDEDKPKLIYPPPINRDVMVVGLARQIETNYFTLDNDARANRWRKFNPQEIAEAIGMERVLPSVLFAELIPNTRYKALGTLTSDQNYPRNKHSQYALFWFIMAGLWIVILGPKLFTRNFNY